MAVEFPSTLTVTCDECGNEEVEVPATEYAGQPPAVGVDEGDLPEGWVYEAGQYLCPSCKAESEEDS